MNRLAEASDPPTDRLNDACIQVRLWQWATA